MRDLNARAIVMIAGLALSGASLAADRHWNNLNGGVFGSPLNWTEVAAPGPPDRAIFDVVGTYVVTFPVNAVTSRMIVGRGDVTLSFENMTSYLCSVEIQMGDLVAPPATLRIRNGALSTIAMAFPLLDANTATLDVSGGNGAALLVSSHLTIAERGVGNVNVAGGTLQSANATVCAAGTTSSTITVGSAGNWTTAQLLFIGLGGDATVNVDAGGTATCGELRLASQFTSQSTVNVTGVNALFQASGDLNIGEGGTGTINVSNGGRLRSNVSRVGSLLGSGMGHVTMTGAASRWEPGISFQVGAAGTGVATIDGGAQVLPEQAGFVGVEPGSNGTLTVRGAGTLVSLPAGQMQVGRDGVGALVIENSGEVRSSGSTSPSQTGAIIGLQGAGNGTATVTGAGSKWTVQSGSMAVGWAAGGTLRVQNGGAVTSSLGYVGRLPSSVGLAEISGTGSSWTCTGDLRIGLDPSNFPGGTGTLRVLTGGTVAAPNVRIGPAGTLGGSSIVQAPVNNAGSVSPGSPAVPAGQLTIQGTYTQTSAGTLRIDVGGASPGTQHDVLAVTGVANLGGTLHVTAIDGFVPNAGSTFTILTASSRVGTFSSVTGAFPGGSWEAVYEPNAVKIRAAGACPGDANGDRVVDFLDLNIVLSFFGQPVPVGTNGDLNADGLVDFLDLNIVLSFFGQAC